MNKKNLLPGRKIGGKYYDQDTFNNLILNFKDSFSRSSLSIELAFNELEEVEREYDLIKNQIAYDFYDLCDRKERNEIDDKMKYFMVFFGHKTGILSGPFNYETPQKIINKTFEEKFSFMFDDMHYILEFDDQGNFLEKDTFRNVGEFFRLIHEKKNAEDIAYNMQKDNMDAFDYAMRLDNIGIEEIIKINELVNYSDPDQEIGFKKTNNGIIGSSMEVADKTTVPTKMVELLGEYQKDFDLEILDPTEYGISEDERMERISNIFKKEAIFHIRFERIHPFHDGNGRTGRILMNKHLLDLGMAPVLITDVDRKRYINYLRSNDYEGLSDMMLSSSAQMLSNWISARNLEVAGKNHDNSRLAKFVVNEDGKKRKKKIFSTLL